jgi:hypothetical protein
MIFVDTDFWEDPPWGNGEKKYRLGLKPIDLNKWLDRKPDQNLFKTNKDSLLQAYALQAIGM